MVGQVTLRHGCDETSCENWDHLLIGTQPENLWDYRARSGGESGPLAGRRSACGRATAIRNAILTARRNGSDMNETSPASLPLPSSRSILVKWLEIATSPARPG